MINHDYRCRRCSKLFEAFVDPNDRVLPCPACEGESDRVYRKFGQMLGKSKGLYPRFDTQLGVTLESAQHMERVAKERGLEVMGNQEWERSRHASRTPDPMDSDEPDPQLIEIAKRAWDDVKFGRVDEEAIVRETAEAAALQPEADCLDVTEAAKAL